jgi:hypothetical protein
MSDGQHVLHEICNQVWMVTVNRGFLLVLFLDLINRFGQGRNKFFEAEFVFGAFAFQEFMVCRNQIG